MKTKLRERNLLSTVLLYFFTLGIYPIYIYFVFGEELIQEKNRLNIKTELVRPLTALLLTFITIGLYGFYYLYQQAQVLKEIGALQNKETFDPVIIVLLALFFNVGWFINLATATAIAKDDTNNNTPTICLDYQVSN